MIRARRQELGWPIQQLADCAGLSAAMISLVERGLAAPSLSSLWAVAECLDLRLVDLFAVADATKAYGFDVPGSDGAQADGSAADGARAGGARTGGARASGARAGRARADGPSADGAPTDGATADQPAAVTDSDASHAAG